MNKNNTKTSLTVKEPYEKEKKEIYKLYETIYHSNLKDKKTKLLTYIFAWYPWSWRVIGISEGAYQRLKEVDFYPKPNKLVRDHFLQDRKVTYSKMIEIKKILDFKDWWDLFWENDPTILMTREEHNENRSNVLCHELNWKEGYFSCNPLIGFKYRKSYEAEYLKNTEFKWVDIEKVKSSL